MKLTDARENYYAYSGKTSDIIRQLGLEQSHNLVVPYRPFRGAHTSGTVFPSKACGCRLTCDLMQYALPPFYGAICMAQRTFWGF